MSGVEARAGMPILERETHSTEETIGLGKEFAASLGPGDVVVLSGSIGAGKTYFAKGIADGLGVPDIDGVNSPTYDLVHEFQGLLPVFHVDFYRLEELSDEDFQWLEECISGVGVCLIEWGEKFIEQFGRPYYQVVIEFGAEEMTRQVSIFKRSQS